MILDRSGKLKTISVILRRRVSAVSKDDGFAISVPTQLKAILL